MDAVGVDVGNPVALRCTNPKPRKRERCEKSRG